MRLGRVRFEISYVVDLDKGTMVDAATDAIWEDLTNVTIKSPDEFEMIIDHLEDASLKESDIPEFLRDDVADEEDYVERFMK